MLFWFGLFFIQNMTANREKMRILNSVYESSMTYLNNNQKNLGGRTFCKQVAALSSLSSQNRENDKTFGIMVFLASFAQRFNHPPHFLRPWHPECSICALCPLTSMCWYPSQGNKGMWEIQTGAHAGLSPVQNWGPAVLNISSH